MRKGLVKLTADSSIFEFSPALVRRRFRLLGNGERPAIPDMMSMQIQRIEKSFAKRKEGRLARSGQWTLLSLVRKKMPNEQFY
jgi:hypothetical protein